MSEDRREKTDGEVVYHRVVPPAGKGGKGAKDERALSEAKVAPMLLPLLVSFLILLALVFLLGSWSGRKLDEVSNASLEMEQQHAIKQQLALSLLLAATKLDNEARARGRAEGAGKNPEELRTRFGTRLTNARKELNDLLPSLDNPTLAGSEKWRTIHEELNVFAASTEDPDEYAREGFKNFRTVDGELRSLLLVDLKKEEDVILRDREEAQTRARRRINLLTWIALLAGALVAAATVWEVQRRFRQMRASLELARRERQFSTQMLEGMVSAVAAVDARDHIRSANTAFFQIFPQLNVGLSLHDPSLVQEGQKMLEAATASRVKEATYRGRWNCDERHPSCAGKTFDVYSSPLEIDGEPGQIIMLVDVTEASRAEVELRRSESLAAVGQAAAQVAHEIKNPLGSIRLGVSMLRDSINDRESLNTIDLVERGINHLNKLAVDVTQFSRVKQLTLAKVNLNTLLEESVELVAEMIKEKRTPIEKRFSSEPVSGEWDEDHLRQVFVNLLANALDASEAGQPVTITTERATISQGDGNRAQIGNAQVARVRITDQGAGIDESTRARIFEPFFTTKKRGTGLGLAIVKQIVEQHNGNISVASEQGKGTTFTVDLPLTPGR
ncbi:MAG: ATP-binding protein [Pyrinomonadaceae bacterium]